ncbi:MIP/aquaporin family protein [Arthrobacter sp. SO3]|uniref:MIP/aquaporin family protein n=1 Tax=Arthrobacter sp. SO3 TaxID=1897057 RepID=UPI001CFF8F82|nr:aquaporin [Arthrobacter sp. SO3]MCB5293665.1 Aquaporin Z [Arthrobacter sp. SO3]
MTTRVSAPEPAVPEPASTPDDPARPGLLGRLSAEALGTFFVVIAGLGVPLFTIPQSSPLPASLAAGLALTAAMLAFGYLSGGHFNPVVTAGNAIAGRIRLADAAAYVGAQLVGALLGAVTLFGLLRTVPNITDTRTAFDTVAAGFGEHSVIQAPMAGVLLIEVLGAALLVAVYLGTTSARNPSRLAAPFAVGLTTAVLLQFGQAPGNTPFNPARATASALFSSPDVLGQLWLFWVAPLVGAALAGLVYRGFARTTPAAVSVPDTAPETGDDDEPDDRDARVSGPAGTGSDEARDFFDGEPGASAGRGSHPGRGE